MGNERLQQAGMEMLGGIHKAGQTAADGFATMVGLGEVVKPITAGVGRGLQTAGLIPQQAAIASSSAAVRETAQLMAITDGDFVPTKDAWVRIPGSDHYVQGQNGVYYFGFFDLTERFDSYPVFKMFKVTANG